MIRFPHPSSRNYPSLVFAITYVLSVPMVLGMITTLIAQPIGLPHNALRESHAKSKQTKVEVLLRSRSECPSNLILLSDLISVQGPDSLIRDLMQVALGPAPRMGSDQTWTRAEVERSLALRGIPPEAISWKGANECLVRRTPGPRPEPKPQSTAPKSPALVDSKIQLASYGEVATDHQRQMQKPEVTSVSVPLVDKNQFTAPFTTQTQISQAENLAALAIGDYLRSKTDSQGKWNIKVSMPTEHTKIFSLRNNILGVAGGQPPWDGAQEFLFRMKENNSEKVIPISATIKLPDMVIAAKRPLSKGYVLKEDDLAWIPMPRGLNYGPEDCYTEADQLVGQQLRRAMSTQQVIRLKEAGPPTIIHVGDLVTIGIVFGAVSVETNGRAMESGAIDDLIQIEVQPHRKRVLARITGDRTAEVISNSSANTNQPLRAVANRSNFGSNR